MNKFVRILLKSGIALLVLLAIVGPVVGIKVLQIQALIASSKQMPPMPATSVTTIPVETAQWNPIVKSVGSVVAVQGVTVTTETPGKVIQIHFESGAAVSEGDLLVELDTSTEKAQLSAAEATLDLTRINLERSRQLFEKDAISKSEYDTAEARFRESEAAVKNLEALIQKKTIVAPFTGRLGIREVNIGQFVGSGQTIVTLQSLNPIFVDSYIPQSKLDFVKVGQSTLVDWSSGSEPITGSVSAVSSSVDESTRSLLVRSKVENSDEVLRPGMFVNVGYEQKTSREVLIVPSTSIIYASYGNSVFVAEQEEGGSNLIAKQQIVKLGETRGDFVEIVDGLEGDEEVVATGAFKLMNGATIAPQNDKGLEFSENPTPADA